MHPGPEARRPVAGRHCPRIYRELAKMFDDDAACCRYLERRRWPKKFACPACGESGEPWRASRGLLVRSACQEHVRVGAGTIFDTSRMTPTSWFEAAWHVATAKSGMSAKTLKQILGTSYRAAWTMLQR